MGKTLVQAARGSTVTSTANTTEYWRITGYPIQTSSEGTTGYKDTKFHSAGVLSNLLLILSANSIAATSTFTLRKNHAAGNQVLSVGSSATGTFEDTTHTDTVASTDLFSLQGVPGASTGTFSVRTISLIYTATTNTVTRMATYTSTFALASSTTFFPLNGGDFDPTEANSKCRMRKAGSLKNMCVNVSIARAQVSTLRSRKNGANGTLVISFTASTTGWFEDMSHTDTVSVGEDWNYSLVTGTGVDSLKLEGILTDFEDTGDDGICICSEPVTGIAVADATVSYFFINGKMQQLNTTEANVQTKARAPFVISEITCLVTQNAVTSASTLNFRVNSANTVLAASITASTTGVFSDSSDTVTLVATDLINTQLSAPSVAGTPTVTLRNIILTTTLSSLTRISLSRIYKNKIVARTSLSRIYKNKISQRVDGPSLGFDGIDDYVDLGAEPTLWSQSLTKFSFSMWVKGGNAFDRSYRTFLGCADTPVDNDNISCYFVTAAAGPGYNAIGFDISNDDYVTQTMLFSSPATTIVNGVWYHVVGTYDSTLGSINAKLYVDGVLQSGTGDLPNYVGKTIAIDSVTKMLLGRYNSAIDSCSGNIKDFRWWTTKVLTQTEVNNIKANNSSAPTPDYWLKMTEGTGSPVDSISGTKTGTLTNGTSWSGKPLPSVWSSGKTAKYINKIQSRISLSRIYKNKIVGRISLTRIYKNKIRARVSLSRIYKNKIATRVSLSRIYKNKIRARISLSRIYKNKILSRVSLTRIYKNRILTRISLSRIYKNKIAARVSLIRIYKNKIAARVSLPRIYKNKIRARVSLTRVYKNRILTRVSLVRIYKNRILTRVSLSRIYKNRILSRISLSRIYKNKIAARVSLSRIYKNKIQARVSLVRIYKNKILQRISLSRIYKNRILVRISLSRIYKNRILVRVSNSRIYKNRILIRVSQARIYKNKIQARVSLTRKYINQIIVAGLTRITLQRVYKNKIQARVSNQRVYKNRILNRITLSRIYKNKIRARVSLTRIYKNRIFVRISLTRVYKNRILTRVSLTRIYKNRILNRVSLSRIYRNRILNRVSLSRIYKNKIQARVSLIRIYKNKMLGRVSLSRIYINKIILVTLTRISLQRVYKNRIQARVSQPRIYKNAIRTRVSLSRIYKNRILVRVSLTRIYRNRILNRISLSRIYKNKIAARVSLSRIYKNRILQRISLSRVYRNRILVRVSLSRIYRNRIFARVSLSRTYVNKIISLLTRISLERTYINKIQTRVSLTRIYINAIEQAKKEVRKGFGIREKIPRTTSFLRGWYDRTTNR